MDFGVPENLHTNIRRSSNAFFIATGLGLLPLAYNWNELMQKMPFSQGGVLAILGCSYAISIIIAWLIRLGKKWVRIPLLILVFLGFVMSIPSIIVGFKEVIWLGIINVVQSGLQIYGAIILFLPETTAWYNDEKWSGFTDEEDVL